MPSPEPSIVLPRRDDGPGSSESPTDESPTKSVCISLPQTFAVRAFGSLFVQLAFFSILVVSRCIPIAIRQPGEGSLAPRYQFLFAVLAGLVSLLISVPATSTLRIVYLKKIQAGPTISRMPEKNSAVVGIASLYDTFRYLHITVGFLIVSIISASFILVVTPSMHPFEHEISTWFFPNHTRYSAESQGSCFTDGGVGSVEGLIWKLGNGSAIGLNATAECELQKVLPFLSQSNAFSIGEDRDLVYSMGGVPVNFTAMGVPYEVPYEAFAGAFGLRTYNQPTGFWSELESVSICLPVLATNPVSCRQSGNVTQSGKNLIVSSNGCTATSTYSRAEESSSGATVAGICAGPQEGTSTIVIGATGSHADELEKTVIGAGKEKSGLLAITCSVNIQPSIAVRRLKLLRYPRKYLKNMNYNFHFVVTADKSKTSPCKGNITVSSVSTSTALVAGAAASLQLLQERSHKDGYLETLLAARYNWGECQGQCNDLEMALWVVSAMGIGTYWGSGQDDDGPKVLEEGVFDLEGVRIGPEQWWACFYLTPLLFSILALVWLLFETRRQWLVEVRSWMSWMRARIFRYKWWK